MEYDYRHPETPEEIENLKTKFLAATSTQKNMLTRFLTGQYEWSDFQADNGCQTLVELGYFISNKPDIEAIIASYLDFGMNVEIVKGTAWHTESMVAINHDGIQYGLDDHGRYVLEKDKNSIEHSIKHFKLMSSHYHNRIKTIHNYLVTKTSDPIWVLAGGGYQMQASFGNKNGFIATLELDSNSFVKVGIENEQRKRSISNRHYDLSMNEQNFIQYFRDFNIVGFNIKIQ